MAARTRHVELHASAGLGNLPTASTLRAFARGLDMSRAMAVAAGVASRNVETHDAAADRCPERHVDLIFEIGTRLWAFFCYARPAASAEDAREDVAETAAATSSA